MKFGRTYSLSVEIAGGQKTTIEPPFTLEFDIQRNFYGAANTGNFRLLNLAEKTRNLMHRDRYSPELRAIQLRAGYDDFTPLVFNGTVRYASSFRTGGSVDVVTEIEAYDGGFQAANGFTSFTADAGATAEQLLATMAASLPGIAGKPIVGSFPTISKRGEAIFGNTWKLIMDRSRGQATIDNGQPKILNANEAIGGEIPLIDASSGLLGSPRRADSLLELDILFEPRLTVGQVVDLKSDVNSIFNGRYKVMSVAHRGTISPAVGGECRTSVSLFLGTQTLQIVSGALVQ